MAAELRKEIKKYIDHADDRMVTVIHAMLKADEMMNEEHIKELNRRYDEYKSGKAKLVTLDEAEKKAQLAAKKIRKAS